MMGNLRIIESVNEKFDVASLKIFSSFFFCFSIFFFFSIYFIMFFIIFDKLEEDGEVEAKLMIILIVIKKY